MDELTDRECGELAEIGYKIQQLRESPALRRMVENLIGESQDRNQPELEQMVFVFCNGLHGQIPERWESYFAQAQKEVSKEEDPEYQRYLELKQKYEG